MKVEKKILKNSKKLDKKILKKVKRHEMKYCSGCEKPFDKKLKWCPKCGGTLQHTFGYY